VGDKLTAGSILGWAGVKSDPRPSTREIGTICISPLRRDPNTSLAGSGMTRASVVRAAVRVTPFL
jgi:hypothetical protein